MENQTKQDRENAYLYWLSNINGIGRKKTEKLLMIKKTAEAVYTAGEEFVDELDFLTQADKELLKTAMQNKRIVWEYEELKRKKIRFLPIYKEGFPKRLSLIPSAPSAIYAIGEVPDDSACVAAVIGARECSEYGRYVAEELGRRLAHEGISVISGMARGIDSEVQRAALDAGGKVFGVLGCGVDICYPKQSMDVYERMKVQGGVLSEYVPGTLPKAQLFPPRNRIISALSDAVIVIEAKEQSGTLITVDMALEQGRDVYVIPGRITDPLSTGCNRLIRQGAEIIYNLDEFVIQIKNSARARKQKTELINIKIDKKQEDEERTIEHNLKDIRLDEAGEVAKEVVRILYLEPKTFQQIYSELQKKFFVEIAELAEVLYKLENMYIIHKKEMFYTLELKFI